MIDAAPTVDLRAGASHVDRRASGTRREDWRGGRGLVEDVHVRTGSRQLRAIGRAIEHKGAGDVDIELTSARAEVLLLERELEPECRLPGHVDAAGIRRFGRLVRAGESQLAPRLSGLDRLVWCIGLE